MDKNLGTLVRLLARQAATEFLQCPELINSYYLLNKTDRPALIEKARTILGRKS